MKKNLLNLLFTTALILSANYTFAQYPNIPADVKKSSDSMMKEAYHQSDIAWEKAKPIIAKEAGEGKPYIPWAGRPNDLPQSKLLAFPGAEGGGAYSFGGHGGRVIVVKNLNDSGPGSLRDACEQGGARIVVFNVAGIIRLKTPLMIRAPYITIAGQTAPGDGICVAGESVWLNTHDVIVRFMRFRRGETFVGRRDDAIGGNPVGNIMIDHVSASWGLDENMSMYRHMYNDSTGKTEEKLGTVNITIQNSIFSEALDYWNHAFGSTLVARIVLLCVTFGPITVHVTHQLAGTAFLTSLTMWCLTGITVLLMVGIYCAIQHHQQFLQTRTGYRIKRSDQLSYFKARIWP
jgi:hypothetical protein